MTRCSDNLYILENDDNIKNIDDPIIKGKIDKIIEDMEENETDIINNRIT